MLLDFGEAERNASPKYGSKRQCDKSPEDIILGTKTY